MRLGASGSFRELRVVHGGKWISVTFGFIDRALGRPRTEAWVLLVIGELLTTKALIKHHRVAF
jgi:hypothetical protein